MNYKCKHCTTVLAIIILVFSFWQVALSWLTSKWIIVAAAVLILLHSLGCGVCNSESCKPHAVVKKAPARKTAKKKTAKKKRR